MTTFDINEGMKVYDANGEELGEVVDVRYGDEDETQPGPETSTGSEAQTKNSNFVTELAQAFVGEDDVPEEVEAYLRRHGYIKIDKGIFQGPRYTTMNNIARVEGEDIHLEVTHDSLVTI